MWSRRTGKLIYLLVHFYSLIVFTFKVFQAILHIYWNTEWKLINHIFSQDYNIYHLWRLSWWTKCIRIINFCWSNSLLSNEHTAIIRWKWKILLAFCQILGRSNTSPLQHCIKLNFTLLLYCKLVYINVSYSTKTHTFSKRKARNKYFRHQ